MCISDEGIVIDIGEGISMLHDVMYGIIEKIIIVIV